MQLLTKKNSSKDFCKKTTKEFGQFGKTLYLCSRLIGKVGSVAQLNRASDYGSEGCGFESRRNHKRMRWTIARFADCSSFSFDD